MKKMPINSLHIFVLFAFAIAPLYDLLSRHATFFVAHDSIPLDILFIVLFLSVILPGGIVIVNGLIRLAHDKAQKIFHYIIIACLIAIIALPVLKKVLNMYSVPPDMLIILGAAFLGLVFTIFYIRSNKLQMLISFAFPAIFIFPFLFLFNSPVYKIIHSTNPNVKENSTKSNIKSEIPIIMVVFDELPVTSLMDKFHQIDSKLYPNFARLAQDAYWFRNANTVSAETIFSIPAILTGKYPEGNRLPQLSEYPNNIFTLLGNTYDINASENCTHLCPNEFKKLHNLDFEKRMSALLSDVSIVYLHLLSPLKLAKKLPAINLTWEGFGNSKKGHSTKHNRSQVFSDFVDSIRNAHTPTLNFIHINIPHFSWIFYPSGKMYGNYGTGTGGINGLNQQWWSGDEWLITQAFQRHLLQVGFTDKLLGDLIKKLKKENLYDSSLFIVTADHGVSFKPHDHLRSITKTNFADIMSVPLFIKLPNQDKGVISDRNIETIDILPTIADILDINLPWAVDGNSMLDQSSLERTENVIFNGPWEEGELNKRYVFANRQNEKYETLKKKLSIFDGELFKIGPYKKLVNHTVNEFWKGEKSPIQLQLDFESLMLDLNLEENFLPLGNLTGKVTDISDEPVYLAVSIDGMIRAVTRTFESEDGIAKFSSILPDWAFKGGKNKIEIFVISEKDEITLKSISTSQQTDTTRTLVKDGNKEVIILYDDKGSIISKIAIDPQAMLGRLDNIDRFEGGQLTFYGWAADVKNSQLPQELLIFINSRYLLSTDTKVKRPGIANSYKVPENCGFYFTIPIQTLEIMTGDKTDIRIFAVSKNGVASEINYPYGFEWSPMFGISYSIEGGIITSPDGRKIPIKSGALTGMLNQTIDKPGKILFTGYAVDVENRQIPESILLFADGKLIHLARTSHYRTDVAKLHGIKEFDKFGFILEIPSNLLAPKTKVQLFALSKNGVASELDYYKKFKWR